MDLTSKYDRAAPRWEQQVARRGYQAAYSGFITHKVCNSGPVLDVGSGPGTFARVWAESGGSPDLTLLDPSQNMLTAAQANLLEIGVKADSAQAQLESYTPAKRFSAILASHVIEHCAAPDIALRLLFEWLAPQGRLFLVVSKPHWCNWLIWLRFRHQWFSENTVLEMGAQAGLDHVETHAFHTGPPSRTSLGYLFIKPGEI